MRKRRHGLLVTLSLATILVSSASELRASWPGNGVAVYTSDDIGWGGPRIVSDGAGGAIVAWDGFGIEGYGIYVQRVDASGVVTWPTSGVSLGGLQSPTIVPDGGGGAIVAWEDSGPGDSNIYAQKVNPSGAIQWTVDGVALCTATGTQISPMIVPDGAGGAIVTWMDERSGIEDVYAQRVNASGAVQWTADGVALCTATGGQHASGIVPDGSGGAIVAWADYRNGNWDIYVQRVDASGVVQWMADGVALCTTTEQQAETIIVSDGTGGAIVSWSDGRGGPRGIYAQRVNASGSPMWTTNGVGVLTAGGYRSHPTAVPDGAGGAIVACEGEGNEIDIYAQRLDGSGAIQWATEGVPLCTAAYFQLEPKLVSDGAEGTIVTWWDERGDYGGDIYAQHVDSSGVVLWVTDGVPLCTATDEQREPDIASDGAGGAIVTWADRRSGYDYHVYAQRVTHLGNIGSDLVPVSTAAIVGAVLAMALLGIRRILRSGLPLI